MSYFLATDLLQLNTVSILEGEEAKHLLLSRRIKVGEQIEVQDSNYARFLCTVQKINKKSLEFAPIKKLVTPQEHSTTIVLYQALVAEQALDTIIKKATELGAHGIVIFPAEYSPHSLRPEKVARWKKIAQEAAKQCGRVRATTIAIDSFENILGTAITRQTFYLSQHASETVVHSQKIIQRSKEIAILVGPEGGWSNLEQQRLASSTAQPLVLSQFVLRADTAAIAALAQINLFVS